MKVRVDRRRMEISLGSLPVSEGACIDVVYSHVILEYIITTDVDSSSSLSEINNTIPTKNCSNSCLRYCRHKSNCRRHRSHHCCHHQPLMPSLQPIPHHSFTILPTAKSIKIVSSVWLVICVIDLQVDKST